MIKKHYYDTTESQSSFHGELDVRKKKKYNKTWSQ